jgi:mono/diheme cytochrome c family protein
MRGKAIKTVLTGMILTLVFSVSSCRRDPLSPGVEYMPDMYRTRSYKAFVNYDHPDSLWMRTPVAGTIAYSSDPIRKYDNLPYAFSNTAEGYEAAGAQLRNPLPFNEVTLAEGKVLYGKYCIMCHGESGKGDGILVQNDKFPPPPSYSGQLKDLVEGKMFHSITYGKGLMGSHASQVTKSDRWKIIMHVQQLQKLD